MNWGWGAHILSITANILHVFLEEETGPVGPERTGGKRRVFLVSLQRLLKGRTLFHQVKISHLRSKAATTVCLRFLLSYICLLNLSLLGWKYAMDFSKEVLPRAYRIGSGTSLWSPWLWFFLLFLWVQWLTHLSFLNPFLSCVPEFTHVLSLILTASSAGHALYLALYLFPQL